MRNMTSTRKLLFATIMLILLVASVVSSIFLKYYFILIPLLPLIIGCIYIIMSIYKDTLNKISFMFDSIDCEDYSFNFRESNLNNSEKMLNISLNRIRNIMRNAKQKSNEREKYYELIINSVKTAIIIINDYGNVYQANNEAKKLFGLDVFTHINQLRFVASNIVDKFHNIKSGEQTLVSYTNEIGEISLFLSASEVLLDGKILRVISANDINNNLDGKEIESWSKLTRVLTHEIMNSLAPITSLSEVLIDINKDKGGDIEKGLEVINTTSKGLVEFVESYRKFTKIHIPEKYPFEILPLISKSIKLVDNDSVCFNVNITPSDIMVYGDEKLVSRTILNILKNAVQGMDNIDDKCIDIDVYIGDREMVVIKISNNGDEIPCELVNDIFMPFFTTKPTGSGIGLSIARQIMHLHGGEIKLTSNNNGRVTFSLIFV